MNKKAEAAAAVERFRDEVIRTRQPNLFTECTVKVSDGPDILITAHDVLEIARIVTIEQIDVLKSKQLNIIGTGTKGDPFRLTTPEQWLWAAVNFVIRNVETPVYYLIGGQLIDVTSDQRKASSRHLPPDSFLQHMQESLSQLTSNMAATDNLNILKGSLANTFDLSSSQSMDPLSTLMQGMQTLLPFFVTVIQNLDTKYIPHEARLEGYRIVLLPEDEKITSNLLDAKVIVLQRTGKYIQANYIKNGYESSARLELTSLELTAEEIRNLSFPNKGEKSKTITRRENLTLVDKIALKFGCTQWDKPYYSSLSTQYNNTQSSITTNMDKLRAITPSAIEQMLTDMRTSKLSDSDASFEQFPEVLDNVVNDFLSKFLGKEKLKELAPDINEGRKLFLRVFGDFNADALKNENVLGLVNKYLARIKQLQFSQDPGYQTVSDAILGSDAESVFRNVSIVLTKTTVDQQAVQAMSELNHHSIMLEIRSILTSTIQRADNYLPVTIGALFFSESSRYILCYIASCALLDLMQLKQFCPDLPEIYTLANILSNSNSRVGFIDVYGRVYSEKEKEIKDMLFNRYLDTYFKDDPKADEKKVNFRKTRAEEAYTKIKEVLAGKVSQNVAGYHPMVQGESYDETKRIVLTNPIIDSTPLVLVQQKIASILLQWLALQLSDGKATICSLGKRYIPTLRTQTSDQVARKKGFLEKCVKPLFKSRILSFDLMNLQKINIVNACAVKNDFTSSDLDQAALESQRAIKDVVISGQRKKCLVLEAEPDGDCGFTATRRVLFMQDEFEIANEIERKNFINLIEKLINDVPNIYRYNSYIIAIFKTDGATNFQEWKTKFSSKGYWVQKEHFALLSHYYNIRFNFYCLQDSSEGNAFVPKLGDETIFEGSDSAKAIIVNLAYLSTRLLNNIDATLNHFDPIFIEPTKAFIDATSKKEALSSSQIQFPSTQPVKSVNSSVSDNTSTTIMLQSLSPSEQISPQPPALRSLSTTSSSPDISEVASSSLLRLLPTDSLSSLSKAPNVLADQGSSVPAPEKHSI